MAGVAAYYNTGKRSTRARKTDRWEDTMCARRAGAGAGARVGGASYFKYRGKNFYKIRVSGKISKANIRISCERLKLKPVCNVAAHRDSHCWTNGKGLYWSYPPHDRMMGVPTSKVRNLFFYGKHGVMYNTGTSHRRARKNSERGYTLCEGFIKPKPAPKPKFAKKLAKLAKGQVSVCSDAAVAEARKAKAAAARAKKVAKKAAAKAAKARADHIARKKRKKLAAAARAAKKAAIAAAKAARAARKAAAEKNKEKAKKLAEKAAKAKRTALKLKRAAARKRPIRISKPVKVSKRAMKKIAKKAGVRMKAPKSRRRRRRRGSGRRRRQGSGNKPKFVGEERQSERAGGKTRTRNRKGAGHGKGPKGCKVSERWANAHLKWCSWVRWTSWSG